jgi:hypothetical protein
LLQMRSVCFNWVQEFSISCDRLVHFLSSFLPRQKILEIVIEHIEG